MRVKSGSAMVITLLLLATVGSISFSIGRLFVLDLTLSRIQDDSVVAYYAAESGIEEGLLRYRFNKNAEIEAGNPGEADNHNSAIRNDFEKYESDSALTSFGNSPAATDRVYDFRMYFKEKELCNVDLGNDDGVCDLTEDEEWIKILANESMKFDITGINKNYYDLLLKPSGENSIAFEAKITATMLGSEAPVEYKTLFITEALRIQSLSSITSGSAPIPSSGVYYEVPKIVEKLVGANLVDFGDFVNPDIKAELYIKPVRIGGTPFSSGDLEFMIKRNNDGFINNSSIAGLYSTIKSTGHYGNVTRTLKAKIDRQSGTLYDVFDFVLYDY